MTARAIWTGSVVFGMLSIPVKLYGATSDKDISFNRLHTDCQSRLKQQNFCPTCARTVESAEIERGYAVGRDQYIVITDDDLENLPLPTRHTIELVGFVPATEIDPVYTEKSYFLQPEIDKGAAKPYALLLRAMQAKGVFGLGKIALRNKERMCVLRATDRTLALETLYWPDEVRLFDEPAPLPDVAVSDAEVAMGGALIEMAAIPFEPGHYTDQYRAALESVIEAKRQGIEPAPVPTAALPAPADDLMATLRMTIEQVKQTRESAA